MKTRLLWALLVVLLAAVGWRAAYLYRRLVWPKPVAWMQDLPPLDRSSWPAPVAWTINTVEREVATPEGLRRTNLTYYVNSIGMELVRVEPGAFWSGLTESQMRQLRFNNQLGHRVTLTRPYYLGAYEVRNREFELFRPAHARRRPSYQRGPEGDEHPVEPVTWQEAQLFCRWLSAKEGRLYRLPTEAEWEYACKAGTLTRTYWGDNVWDRNKANTAGVKNNVETWLEDGFRYSAPVGCFPPNPWGLYDIIGNAREWVNDWYAPYETNALVDPVGPTNRGQFRVMKGVGWSTRTRHITSSTRDGNNPADLHDVIGFRVLCELAPGE
jgi:formylglycine-generating enzyme required for sulfatase activity